MKLFSNTTAVLGVLTKWDKVTATVGEFTGHLWALCLAIPGPTSFICQSRLVRSLVRDKCSDPYNVGIIFAQ